MGTWPRGVDYGGSHDPDLSAFTMSTVNSRRIYLHAESGDGGHRGEGTI